MLFKNGWCPSLKGLESTSCVSDNTPLEKETAALKWRGRNKPTTITTDISNTAEPVSATSGSKELKIPAQLLRRWNTLRIGKVSKPIAHEVKRSNTECNRQGVEAGETLRGSASFSGFKCETISVPIPRRPIIELGLNQHPPVFDHKVWEEFKRGQTSNRTLRRRVSSVRRVSAKEYVSPANGSCSLRKIRHWTLVRTNLFQSYLAIVIYINIHCVASPKKPLSSEYIEFRSLTTIPSDSYQLMPSPRKSRYLFSIGSDSDERMSRTVIYWLIFDM